MLDESLLDAPEALARADVRGLLRGSAQAGARVRTALRQATEAGLGKLQPDGRPRALLVAGPGPATACIADVLGALTGGAVPVSRLRPSGALAASGALRWSLPGWAGPLDLLLLVTPDGTEPGLTALIEQAYRRGCTVVAVTPGGAPLADAVGETRGLAVPLAPGPHAIYESPDLPPHPVEPAGPDAADVPGVPDAAPDDRPSGSGDRPSGEDTQPSAQSAEGQPSAAPGTFWALLTPLLLLTDRLGLAQSGPPAIEALADRLDEVAERCGPAIAPYSNPGKTLAAELAGALPLLWSEGDIAAAAARHWVAAFGALPGRPALAAELPEAMTSHGALLSGAFSAGSNGDDFFRDRVDEPEALHARVVLMRDSPTTADSSAVAARDLTYAHDTPLSELEPAEGSSVLEAAAELIATADFAAVYLTIADSHSPWS
ncbi:mannose-6-phosphate isomerase [Streptomyces sp. NBC_01795]|uniref:SIS domain-containing protein n=1 Tax=unclassified Streptomyces TaxID=2593676 RepID=UPI002DDC8F90|nr:MULTISPECIES: SIS domain-containing protein [unclassified Streptomyces]WSA94368.1 mannose-6-phosphate isomerase [Streptomyces sp. NBC_01795]WSS13010.1 mannose-6-phosphate isomerase [Streptomyces sp. NBC_01186]